MLQTQIIHDTVDFPIVDLPGIEVIDQVTCPRLQKLKASRPKRQAREETEKDLRTYCAMSTQGSTEIQVLLGYEATLS